MSFKLCIKIKILLSLGWKIEMDWNYKKTVKNINICLSFYIHNNKHCFPTKIALIFIIFSSLYFIIMSFLMIVYDVFSVSLMSLPALVTSLPVLIMSFPICFRLKPLFYWSSWREKKNFYAYFFTFHRTTIIFYEECIWNLSWWCLYRESWSKSCDIFDYRNNRNYSDTQNICCSHPKIWTRWLYQRVMHLKDAAKIANKDPDQTAPLGAVWSGSAPFA